MADDEELYLANLDEFVNDEDKIVTYKWLSRTLSVSVNRAKQMLYAFVQKQKTSKSAPHLSITYIIGGRCSLNGEIVHRYVVTQDENLEETKKTFSLVTSLHIYSVQKCKLKDSNSLYTVDYDIQQQHNNESNRWSHIYCPAAVPLADRGVNRSTQRINGLENGEKCPTTKMVNGSCEPGTTQKGTSNLASEQKGKNPGLKSKKGQMSALESMFTAKPSSLKAEKSKNEKPQDTNDARQEEVKAGQGKADSSKAGNIKSSFFGKATTANKASEKQGSTEKDKEVISKKTEVVPKKKNDTAESLNQKKRELSPEDEEEEPLPSEIAKAIKSDSVESNAVKGDKKKTQRKEEKETGTTKSNKVGKKKAMIHDSDEELEKKPKKRRKRTKELPKEDSSDDEQAVTNDEPEKKAPSDQGSSRSESPLPQQQPRQTENGTSRRRKRKRQLKSKTYMNDEGFMVTEKVWESDSTDASDEDLQTINDPPVNNKRPSPAKKPNKKAHTDAKSKSTKQASLTSFFKKS